MAVCKGPNFMSQHMHSEKESSGKGKHVIGSDGSKYAEVCKGVQEYMHR